jgi:hypothetical protein
MSTNDIRARIVAVTVAIALFFLKRLFLRYGLGGH